MSSGASDQPARERPCRCEEPPADAALIPEYRFGSGALLLSFLGVTPTPRRVDFLCPACRRVVATLREPQALARWIRRS